MEVFNIVAQTIGILLTATSFVFAVGTIIKEGLTLE